MHHCWAVLGASTRDNQHAESLFRLEFLALKAKLAE